MIGNFGHRRPTFLFGAIIGSLHSEWFVLGDFRKIEARGVHIEMVVDQTPSPEDSRKALVEAIRTMSDQSYRDIYYTKRTGADSQPFYVRFYKNHGPPMKMSPKPAIAARVHRH